MLAMVEYVLATVSPFLRHKRPRLIFCLCFHDLGHCGMKSLRIMAALGFGKMSSFLDHGTELDVLLVFP